MMRDTLEILRAPADRDAIANTVRPLLAHAYADADAQLHPAPRTPSDRALRAVCARLAP